MKLKLSTLAGMFALGSGGYTLLPLALDVYDKGRIVWDVCLVPLSAFSVSVTAFFTGLYLYLKPSPTQAKVIEELKK